MPKLRSIDFLSPEQLRRKREGDRKSQRYLRDRTKLCISELEMKVGELSNKNQALENELCLLRLQSNSQQSLLSAGPVASMSHTTDEDPESSCSDFGIEYPNSACNSPWNSVSPGMYISPFQDQRKLGNLALRPALTSFTSINIILD
jgi:hypothetical protein